MLKAREVRDYIKAQGHEKGTVYCIEVLAEQQAHMMKRIVELAMYFDKMVDSMDNTVNAMGNVKSEMQKMQNMIDDDGLGPNTERIEGKDN
jgi:hypothetical protein